MSQVRRRAWSRYTVPLLAVAGCLLLRRALSPLIGDSSCYLLLLAAPMVASWFGGLGPGLFAVALAVLCGDDSYVPALRLFFGNGSTHDWRLVLFILEGAFVSWLTENLHQARRSAEESQRRLTSSDVRKDEFLATLGHELRNPLTTVRHAVAILKDPRARDSQVARARETLERQADYMTRLIDDILDVSRITRGVLTFEMQRIDLRDAAAQAVEQCRTFIDGRRHELAMSIPRDPVWIEGDAVRLTQVISNLLVNAAKYTDEGGRIALEISQNEAEAMISVRDNGMGIAPEMLTHVFQLFTQTDRARTRCQGGLGLGLAVVRSIAERHGGSVMALSAGCGRGSEFIVRLPHAAPTGSEIGRKRSRRSLAIVRNAPAAKPGPREEARPARRILVVDDNTDVATSLGTILKLDGYEVRLAHTARMAIDVARSQLPDVMLLDLRLPDGDGCEIVQRLNEDFRERPPVLIALTGYWGEEVRQKCLDAGFHAFLLKPVRPADLLQTIADCLSPDRSRPVSRLSDTSIAMRGA